MIYVTGPRDKKIHRLTELIPGITVVNTTSSAGWSSGLSPFKLGPCPLYGGLRASLTMENAWQYAKVYERHVGPDGLPTENYWIWARVGWNNPRGVRYPMGKGAKPKYSWWDGQRLDYITARKRIYLSLYAAAVLKADAYHTLKHMAGEGDLALWDYDGYNHVAAGRPLIDVLNDPSRPMGHAFVIAMLLTGALNEEEIGAYSRGETKQIHLKGIPIL